MQREGPSRRERLRAEATREIKAIAMRLLGDSGPDAVTLRAIAREMGMTAGGLYGYFPTRDDLITTLISDVYTALVGRLESARDAVPPRDPAGRVIAWGTALREWALENPAGFRLVYGDPVRGYRAPPGGPARVAELRACTGLVGLAAAAWPQAASTHTIDETTWADFDSDLVDHVRHEFPDLPPSGLVLALRMWGRMHGLVALEVYGHLRTPARNPFMLHQAEMAGLVRSLGLRGTE